MGHMAVLNLNEVVFDCADPAGLARFWGAVFGTEAVVRSHDWAYIESESTRTRIAFQKVPEGKVVKNRLHLDVEVDDLAAETARVVGLGARTLAAVMTDEQGSFQVLADPEGNEFCLVI